MQAKKTLTAPALVLSVLLLLVSSRYIDSAVLGYGDQLYLSLIILRLIVFILPCIIYIKMSGSGYTFKLNLRFAAPSRIGFMLLAFFTLVTGSAAIKMLITYMGSNASEFFGYESVAAITDATTLTEVLYIVTTFAVLPAVTEEIVFRGVILTEYSESGLGAVWAVIFGSVLYSLVDFRAETLLLFFFVGIILSLTVYVTRSVFGAMLIHMLYNIFNIFFEGYILKLGKIPDNIVLVSFIIVFLFLLSLVFMLGEAERLYYNDALTADEEDKTDEKKDKHSRLRILGEATVSPSLLLCIGVFVTVLIIKTA